MAFRDCKPKPNGFSVSISEREIIIFHNARGMSDSE